MNRDPSATAAPPPVVTSAHELWEPTAPRTVVVLRGMSGSGKSTLARELASLDPSCMVVSADDHFMTPEGYVFDLKQLGQAHASCFRRFLDAMTEERHLIVVDNTNLAAWEASPYMVASAAFGYIATIVDVDCSPEVAASRNAHNVPPEVLLTQAALLEHEALPGAWRRVRWQPALPAEPVEARNV